MDHHSTLHPIKGPMPRLIFRFTGRFDWKRIYRESKEFFVRRIAASFEFTESRYQHKAGKLDVKWEVLQNYDAYYQIIYKIHFRIVRPRTVVVTEGGVRRELMEGAMLVWMEYQFVEDYEVESPAGSPQLFTSSWLRAIYRKITWRDRWDLVDDIGLFTLTDFMEFLKKETHMYAGGYASVWEPG